MTIDTSVYLLVASLIGAVCIILLLRAAQRPFRNIPLKRLQVYLDMLFRRGHNGAFLIISEMDTSKFVQFAKYVKRNREVGLELSFPNAPWAKPYYESLKTFLKDQNIEFVVTPVESKPTTEFIEVDCGSDLHLAYRLVEGIFSEVFRLPGERFFKVKTSKISPRDEFIDTPQ